MTDALEEAREQAARFVREELADFRPERIVSIRGDIAVSRANAELLEPAHAWGYAAAASATVAASG